MASRTNLTQNGDRSASRQRQRDFEYDYGPGKDLDDKDAFFNWKYANPNNEETCKLNNKEWFWCKKCNAWTPHNTAGCYHPDGYSHQRPTNTNNDNTSSSTSTYLAVAPACTNNRSQSTQRQSTNHTHAYHSSSTSSGRAQRPANQQRSPRNRTSWALPDEYYNNRPNNTYNAQNDNPTSGNNNNGQPNNNTNERNDNSSNTQTRSSPAATLTRCGWKIENTGGNNQQSGGWGTPDTTNFQTNTGVSWGHNVQNVRPTSRNFQDQNQTNRNDQNDNGLNDFM